MPHKFRVIVFAILAIVIMFISNRFLTETTTQTDMFLKVLSMIVVAVLVALATFSFYRVFINGER